MENYTLNNVRSVTNTGMVFLGSTYDPCFANGWFSTTPNISINGITCYLDYSDTYNTSDRILLKKIFSTIPVGTSIYISPTDYYDEVKNIRTNLGGTFLYVSSFNDNKCIVGTISSGFTAIANYNFFDKNNFALPLQFTMGYTGGATAANYIVHSLPNKTKTPFSNCGVLGSSLNFEEYIEISGSTLNSGRLKIYGYIKLKDNREVLYTTISLTNEDRFSTNSTLNYYIRGDSDVSIIEKPQAALGSYTIYDANLVKQDCYDNQNEYQTYLRSQAIGSTYYGYWSPCQTCNNYVDIYSYAKNGNKTLYFVNSIYFLISAITATTSITNYIPYGVYTTRDYGSTKTAVSTLNFSLNFGNIKLDLSHPSLQGWSVDIYTDINLTQLLTTSYYRSGLPGFDQSYILLLYGSYLPKTVYCVFNGAVKLVVTLNIS